MKRIRYWLSSKRRQMAKLHDLQRQLQEAWDDVSAAEGHTQSWVKIYVEEVAKRDSVLAQLHRVARERDKERELRLAAEELSKHPLYKEE